MKFSQYNWLVSASDAAVELNERRTAPRPGSWNRFEESRTASAKRHRLTANARAFMLSLAGRCRRLLSKSNCTRRNGIWVRIPPDGEIRRRTGGGGNSVAVRAKGIDGGFDEKNRRNVATAAEKRETGDGLVCNRVIGHASINSTC